MSGRIRDEDVARVRELAPIAGVVGEYLQLRAAGGAGLKGLCPFHDERSPSFHVTPDRGLYHCFGCGEGGDVIRFVERMEHLTFTEAVEKLAARAGVQLTYQEGGAAPRAAGRRRRLIEAHQAAVSFYAGQLDDPEAAPARELLQRRGFDRSVWADWGVGYAPAGWDALVRHLTGRGWTADELLGGGLVKRSQRGNLIDAFRGRLVWPIRDTTGDPVGFNARRLRDDDPGPKYLNTAETPIFRKGSVLYGLDVAKREIARRQQAVVVEGVTDVMACHLAGVPTAVATCGTAFGADHIAVLRRVLMDQDEFRGEVIFTFDGDAAGQRAALRAFAEDQRFVAQTFVAVQPDGLDPCDLRLARGDAAVRDLVARRVPLFEFAIRATLARHDLEHPEGRVAALAAAAPVVARIRDRSLRPEYARRLAGWLGMEVEAVVERVAELAGGAPSAGPVRAESRSGSRRREPAPGRVQTADPAGRPDPADPRLAVERETVKVAVQHPALAGPVYDALEPAVFTSAGYAAVHAATTAAGGTATARGGADWVARVRDACPDDQLRSLVTELAVEPVRESDDRLDRYAASLLARLQELAVTRRISEVKSRVQRLNPVEFPEEYNRVFGDLLVLEQRKRRLREQSIGTL